MHFFQKNKHKKNTIKLARVISFVFQPIFILAFIVVGMAFLPFVDLSGRWFFFLFFLIFTVFLPALVIWLGFRRGYISDIDFTHRKERIPFIAITLFFWTVALFWLWFLDSPLVFLSLFVAAYIILLIFLFITFFWKVSNHALAISIFAFLVNQFFDWRLQWIFLLVPIVAWSRWIQKKHTIAQLIVGSLLGFIFWVVFVCIGY